MCRFCLSVISAIILIGCGGGDGPDLGTVSGTVTLDGKALANATLTFTPTGEKGGRPSIAITDDDGEYELKYTAALAGAPPGEYEVSITTSTSESDDDGNDIETEEILPAKYNAATVLKKTIEPGSNTIDFALDRKGKVHDPNDDNEMEDSPDC